MRKGETILNVVPIVYVLTQYYKNYEDYEDKTEDETILKAFNSLEKALSYENKKFKKSIDDGFYKEDYMYVSEDEEMEDAYMNYRIYLVEVQEDV